MQSVNAFLPKTLSSHTISGSRVILLSCVDSVALSETKSFKQTFHKAPLLAATKHAEEISRHDMIWNERYSELKQFVSQHGHSQVPHNFKTLGRWVTNQRQAYKSFHQPNKKSSMTLERIEALNSIGFKWNIKSHWRDMFAELKKYKNIHGDCLVPYKCEENPKLGRWVSNQRHDYKLYCEGKKSSMTEKRIAALVSIEFEFGNDNRKNVDKETRWNERFQELIQYKNKYGDCNVSNKFQKNQELARWVSGQRIAYRLLKNNQESPLTERRKNMLEGIGFIWNPQNAAWDHKFEMLEQYLQRYDQTDFPLSQDNYPQLASWVRTQRIQLRLFQEGKPSNLTGEQAAALENTNFDWQKRNTLWAERYQQLQQYKQEHGDCLVPQKYNKNLKLGLWVKNQRQQMKLFRERKKSSMTHGRAEKLDKIGFVWDVRCISSIIDPENLDICHFNKDDRRLVSYWRGRFQTLQP